MVDSLVLASDVFGGAHTVTKHTVVAGDCGIRLLNGHTKVARKAALRCLNVLQCR